MPAHMSRPAEAMEPPKRILLTTDALGGVWHYTLALATGLAAAGCDCHVAVLGPAPSPAQRAQARQAGIDLSETGLPLDWTAPSPAGMAATAASLAQRAAASRADLVHLHTPALVPFAWPAPVVAVAHSCVGTWWDAVRGGPLPPDLQWRAAQFKQGLLAAGCTIAPSHSFVAALQASYGARFATEVIHNGHDGPAAPQTARTGPVLCAGRLWDDAKNMAVLDRAAGLAGLHIEAAGDAQGPGGAAFAARHLRLVGALDQAGMEARLRRAALFAAPSLYEPFGLAVLEAASCGTPLVLADIVTFRELWEGAAVFVPPRDAEGWAYAIQSLLDDPDRRAELGATAATRAALYSRAAMVQRTLAVHRRVYAAALVAA